MLTINDRPMHDTRDAHGVPRTATAIATVGIFVILTGVALSLARPILLPTVSALVIGTLLSPLAERARRHGVPSWVTAAVLLLLILGLLNGVIVLVSAPVVDYVDKLPQIGSSIRDKLHVFDRPLAALLDLRRAILPEAETESGIKINLMNVVQPALETLTPAVGQLLVFFGTLYFVLLTRVEMRQRLVRFFTARSARLRTLRILNDVEHNLTRYLGTVTVINLGLGVVASAAYLLIGMPNALAWGVLAAVLNFIPYVGPLIMEVILFGVGLIAFPTLGQALIAPLVHLGLSTVEGHLITPAVVGRRLTMNPLAVFLALVFWTWLWGPVGAFLSVPLLIVVLVVMTHVKQRQPVMLPR